MAKVPRIGFLSANSPTASPNLIEAFQQGLREHGYVEGSNIPIQYRWVGERFKTAKALGLTIYVTHNVAEAVYLADRIVVITPHPGTVRTELKIALPRMRDPLRVEFLEYQREVIAHLTGLPERR